MFDPASARRDNKHRKTTIVCLKERHINNTMFTGDCQDPGSQWETEITWLKDKMTFEWNLHCPYNLWKHVLPTKKPSPIGIVPRFTGFAKVHLQHHENEAAQGDEVMSGRSHHVMLLKAIPYFDVHQIHRLMCNYTYMLSSWNWIDPAYIVHISEE